MKPSRNIEWLLDHLCREHGHCLPADKAGEIIAIKNWEPDRFAIAILRAEGFEYPEQESELHRVIVSAFNRWFDR